MRTNSSAIAWVTYSLTRALPPNFVMFSEFFLILLICAISVHAAINATSSGNATEEPSTTLDPDTSLFYHKLVRRGVRDTFLVQGLDVNTAKEDLTQTYEWLNQTENFTMRFMDHPRRERKDVLEYFRNDTAWRDFRQQLGIQKLILFTVRKHYFDKVLESRRGSKVVKDLENLANEIRKIEEKVDNLEEMVISVEIRLKTVYLRSKVERAARKD